MPETTDPEMRLLGKMADYVQTNAVTDGWGETRERHWATDCLHWRHRVLTGKFRHWCAEWDGLPVDETMPEWPCGCFSGGIPPL